MSEIYVSADIEANGPIPGPYSLWSLGCVAYNDDGLVIGTFSANLLDLLEDGGGDPETMAWWQGRPEAFAKARENARYPEEVMREFVAWIEALPGVERDKRGEVGNVVVVAYPTGYDVLFVQWYLVYVTKWRPCGLAALDIQTYAAAMLRCDFTKAKKKNYPPGWLPKVGELSHVAVEDAAEQGQMFLNMRAENLSHPLWWRR